MTLPNFLIIGAQKAGTSWLAYQLEKHPEVYLPKKEIHYFDKEFNYAKGLDWYKSHFDSVTTETAIGEKTPEYLWANGAGWEDHLSNVHKNLFETLPNARLIITLRNPVDRAISALHHIIRSGRISPLHDINERYALPIVSTKHAGIPEAVEESKTGCLVDEGDSQAMAQNIIDLAKDHEKRVQLGYAGWEKAKDKFSWEQERKELCHLMELEK